MTRIENRGLVYYQFATMQKEQRLRHGVFTRLGGVSRPPYATLNVGSSVSDDPEAVENNRQRCYAAMGFKEDRVITSHQVHGTTVIRVGLADCGRVIPHTDGLITDETGVALFLRFADCVPIVLYDRERQAIGLVHAGWRGTLAGIASQAVKAMQAHFGSLPDRVRAGIGPAIGPCCYEVSPELAIRFARRFGEGVVSQSGQGRPHLDLAMANAIALEETGIAEIERAGICTACHCDEFFSHRAEHGRTGRFAVLVGLSPDS